MQKFWNQNWFLISLTAIIAVGLIMGGSGNAAVLAPVTRFIDPRVTTACVLFLMSITLNTAQLAAAARAPVPVLIGVFVNFGCMPAIGWFLSRFMSTPDMMVGLLIAACVPCTTAAASVFTRKAGGNDAVSLLITIVTNLGCVVITPWWLAALTTRQVPLDVSNLMKDLLLTVLVPTVAAQLLRQIPAVRRLVDTFKAQLSMFAQVLIETIVLSAALKAGSTLLQLSSSGTSSSLGDPTAAAIAKSVAETANGAVAANVVAADGVSFAWMLPDFAPMGVADLLLAWICAVVLHVLAMTIGYAVCRGLGVVERDQTAVMIAGSQKTLPIALYLATDPAVFGSSHPFAMLPMLMFHTSQLFLDTWLASRWSRNQSTQMDSSQPIVK